ncbi:glycoside hydrolase family 3 C-terminal domain-containing protein [Microbacterium gorillae]|uniref:glycoside hydrolase family 3 C-terminal domain-containing protein n=1 Tax=Microbacterium gorillae TaxID=1231063 RepID=UPI003D97356E
MSTSANDSIDVDAFVDKLSDREKALLGSGAAFWVTKEIGGLPRVVLEDGPHGVRHQSGDTDHMGIAPSDPATCFPPATALAQTWDPELLERVGEALGREARAFGTDVLLGPGVNIKRDPRCGRNFEYFSEDPVLSGHLGAAWVTGLQREGAGASVKHFAANNQELNRMRVSADIDERPLREIFLKSFERVIRNAHPWTVMAAYNKLNGVAATENEWLLTQVLREDWGYDGLVVSDWGAVGNRVAATRAGLDLQMPGGDASADEDVIEAVERGEIARDVLTARVRRVVQLAKRAEEARRAHPNTVVDHDAHHALAREVASRAIVLLKNAGDLLPLSTDKSIAVVGPFASEARIQGGGSSRVVPTRVDVPLDELRSAAPEAVLSFAHGYRFDGSDQEELTAEAVALAETAHAALVFIGLTAAEEAEGTDRVDIDIPPHQIELLRAVANVQPRTVAVIVHGGVVRLAEVAELVPAVVDASILGQAGGGAIADVIFGAVNPSGRLAETVPLRLEDAPSFPTYPGDQLHSRYGEGILVGYRGYDFLNRDVAFPFGHGLSYTRFGYADADATASDERVQVSVTVTNEGERDGREVVQVYLSKPDSAVQRAPRELKAFRAVEIAAGEEMTVALDISRSDLAYWDIQLHRWVVEGGTYQVHVGASSRDIRASVTVEIEGDDVIRPFTEESTIGELLANPTAAKVIADALQRSGRGDSAVASNELGIDANKSAMRIPVGRIRSLSGGTAMPKEKLTQLLEAVNAALR